MLNVFIRLALRPADSGRPSSSHGSQTWRPPAGLVTGRLIQAALSCKATYHRRMPYGGARHGF
jgi:hypothetical protein